MTWTGHLTLDYRLDGARTTAHDRHEGPLRVLQRLYPEGDAICHHVLVHPPGGIAGGDVLEVDAGLGPGTHAVVTTPGATRFYRSSGAAAVQRARLRLQAGARLEWLPLETLAYDACIAENHLRLDLEPGAQALGWDVLALGLPAADAPFVRGSFLQHLEWPGRWLERARIAAGDPLLLDSPLGWAGRRVLGTVWFAGLGPSQDALREQLLEGARAAIDAAPPGTPAGATSPHPGLVVARVLAPRVEPAMRLLQAVRAAWRLAAWGLQAQPPRVWAT
jgi:urease accessory protein